ncbi:hypothetical protein [Flavobacterium aciduliphilum]|uniref:Uncharacterized protein n=1 Tax=Flavobacterium aciduliphilum TaxID=1101402 RepID=A0A328YUP1_9FLAO|nr:hypothetical protein [Flavobacterium aciduliphilum]RAR74267.1 hypothetical protein CLV55_102200 [Flavobacterium aciduliphilum]
MKFRLYFLLLIASIFLFIFSHTTANTSNFTINLESTFFVMTLTHFYRALAILLLTVSLLYIVKDVSKVKIKPIYERLHVFGTIVLVITLLYLNNENNVLKTRSNISDEKLNFYNHGLELILISLILFQFLFLMNTFAVQVKQVLTSSKQ